MAIGAASSRKIVPMHSSSLTPAEEDEPEATDGSQQRGSSVAIHGLPIGGVTIISDEVKRLMEGWTMIRRWRMTGRTATTSSAVSSAIARRDRSTAVETHDRQVIGL
jgi:hypothetical protein